MNSAGAAFPVRPLSIGEIFDRAVTLYVRYFGLFTLIMLVVVLPLSLVAYGTTLGSGSFQQILDQAAHPERQPTAASIGQIVRLYEMLFLVFFVQLVLMPFAFVALGSAVADIYASARASWRASYAAALRRWPSILGTEFMTLVILTAAGVAAVLVFTVLIVVAALLSRGAAGAVVVVVMTVLAMIVTLFVFGLIAFALGFAFLGVCVEKLPVFSAIGAGFARIFDRKEIGRAILVLLGIAAVTIGIQIVATVLLGLIEGLHRNLALYELVAAPLSLVSNTFTGLLFAVYYFDVRVRREGLDVQSALERLE